MDRSGTKYSDTLEVVHNLKCHHEITAGEKNCLFFFFPTSFALHCVPKCWPRRYRARARAVCG